VPNTAHCTLTSNLLVVSIAEHDEGRVGGGWGRGQELRWWQWQWQWQWVGFDGSSPASITSLQGWSTTLSSMWSGFENENVVPDLAWRPTLYPSPSKLTKTNQTQHCVRGWERGGAGMGGCNG
jgi:hypothetical protein